MFESTDAITIRRTRQDHPVDRLPRVDPPIEPVPDDGPGSGRGLDGREGRNLHARLMSFYMTELEKQGPNRREMELDFEFYDGNQWDEADVRVLQDRGQRPLTYNVVKTTLNWILGSERRTRTDFKVLGRRADGAKQAELKTDLLKYLSDVNRAGFHESAAFAECAIGGLGWLEEAVQDDAEGEPVYIRAESWRNMLHDSSATEMDLADGRYVFRSKWVDLDIAQSWFPKRAGHLRLDAQMSTQWGAWDYESGDDAMDAQERLEEDAGYSSRVNDFGYHRDRVRLIEAWYRKVAQVSKMRGGQFAGEIFDPYSRGHRDEVAASRCSVVSKTEMRMHVAVMTPNSLLYVSESPYRHNRFPFTPIWCYRRNADNLPYGVVRDLRGPQTDINHRASKALHILSTNKTIMDEGAVEDLDKYLEEVSRADSVIVKRAGKELKIGVDRELSAAHLELMSRSIAMIQQTSGVTDENLGRKTNATSGIAINSRQEQGALATALIFDNLHLAKQISGEKRLSLIEQFFGDEKTFRITNQRGTPRYVTVNSGLPDDDITATKADFIISEDEWRATVRQAQTEQLVGLLKELGPVAPQAVLTTLDLIVEGMDIANRDEIVRRIRQTTGMSDPDATEPTEEENAKAQEAADEKDRMIRMQEAEIADKEASAAQKKAAAGKTDADMQKVLVSRALEAVNTQKAALESALAALSVPGAVPVADQILHESGFVSRSEDDEKAAAAEAELAAAEEQAAMEEAAMQQQAAAQPQQQQPPQPGAQQSPAALMPA